MGDGGSLWKFGPGGSNWSVSGGTAESRQKRSAEIRAEMERQWRRQTFLGRIFDNLDSMRHRRSTAE